MRGVSIQGFEGRDAEPILSDGRVFCGVKVDCRGAGKRWRTDYHLEGEQKVDKEVLAQLVNVLEHGQRSKVVDNFPSSGATSGPSVRFGGTHPGDLLSFTTTPLTTIPT